MIPSEQDRKYVFICGMARSGTSVLSRNVARLEGCTMFKNTGVPEDEGQFLQDVYPIASRLGGSSRCGFHPHAHRTENSPLLTPQNIDRLRASWHAHWDDSMPICIEKTPENLLMTRFLQAAFPNSYFIAIRRHPVPVSIAGQRWRVNLTSLHRQFDHWLRCHELFDEDKRYLSRVYELKYEEYVEDPARFHAEIAKFLGTRLPHPDEAGPKRLVAQWRNPSGLIVEERKMEQTTSAHNLKYFQQWAHLVRHSRWRKYFQYIAHIYEPQFKPYNYSLLHDCGIRGEELAKIAEIKGAGRCFSLLADTHAFFVRTAIRMRWSSKRTLKALLPEPFLAKLRERRAQASRCDS